MLLPDLPEGFSDPDWAAPLDVRAARDRTPEDVRLRGHFFALVLDEATSRGITLRHPHRYYSFKLYPARDFFDLVEEAAPKLFPHATMREGIRRLGRSAFTSFADTRIGRMMYGMFGSTPAPALRMAEKGYGVTITRGRAEVLDHSENHVTLAIREMYTFVDAYHVGLIEGVVAHYGCIGRVSLRKHSDTDADIRAEWIPKLKG